MSANAAVPAIAVQELSKTYASGFTALHAVSIDIPAGEIFALLGPNGAGKTTLISIVCGIVNPSGGRAAIAGLDVVRDYRAARRLVGLVPQELTTDRFETVTDTVNLTRGLFGLGRDGAVVERVLRDLSLWDKRDSKIYQLSGGMKRRVMIAKALAHEPRILFLDEPTAGVDVELRRDMWGLLRRLREQGVTIVLTTHYIEEAEAMADRVGVINKGRLIMVEDKAALMAKMGTSRLTVTLTRKLGAIPPELDGFGLVAGADGTTLAYDYDQRAEETGVGALLRGLDRLGVQVKDLTTRHSTLEEIFVSLVHGQ